MVSLDKTKTKFVQFVHWSLYILSRSIRLLLMSIHFSSVFSTKTITLSFLLISWKNFTQMLVFKRKLDRRIILFLIVIAVHYLAGRWRLD